MLWSLNWQLENAWTGETPLVLPSLDPLGSAGTLCLRGGQVSWCIGLGLYSCLCEAGHAKTPKPAPSYCLLKSWHGGSAGWPPLTGKAICFHSQSVSIRIKEKGEIQFFWCQTGRKTLQRTGGNEAIMHKGAQRQWELGHFCGFSLK